MSESPSRPIDWYRFGDDYANVDHSDCASLPSGDIVQLAHEAATMLENAPDESRVPEQWRAFSDNDAIFGYEAQSYRISSAGADVWNTVNAFGAVYHPRVLRDGG